MEEIEIEFALQERDLIINHTFADPYLTDRIKIAEVKGKNVVAKYSIEDIGELIGFIAAESNHTEDKKLQKKLDKLFIRLNTILDKVT